MDSNPQVSVHGHSPGAVVEPSLAERFRRSKAVIPTLAVLGVTVMALATALVVGQSEAQPGGSTTATTAAQALQPAPQRRAATGEQVAPRAPTVVAQSAPRNSQPRAASCANCGVVESAVAVQRKGKVKGVDVGNTTVGIGTVAGGVLGGVLGNQVGGGNGRTAMTVIGAAGGAYAGNRVEQNMKTVTVHQMRVKMNDGSVRTIEQPDAVAIGSRVVVEGNGMRLAGN